MLIEEGLVETVDMSGKVKSRIQRVVERIYDEAEAGEAWPAQTPFERVDGRVATKIETTENAVVLVLRGASLDDI